MFDKGRRNNPENHRIVLDEAFIYFIYTKDYEKASELFNEASEIVSSENRKSSLKGMAALALSKAGNIELSKKINMEKNLKSFLFFFAKRYDFKIVLLGANFK